MLAKIGLLYPLENGKPVLSPRWEVALRKRGLGIVHIDAGEEAESVNQKLAMIDGLLLPGGDSNVHPEHYGQKIQDINGDVFGLGQFFNDKRDYTSFHLVREAIRLKIPTLAICRGMQEANVALGGVLEQRVHGHDQGYCPKTPYETEVHGINVKEGGLLSRLITSAAKDGKVRVNSIHMQGILRSGLAKEFDVEAMACDGKVVEAVSISSHPFFLATQFHVELKSSSGANERILDGLTAASIQHYLVKTSRMALPSP